MTVLVLAYTATPASAVEARSRVFAGSFGEGQLSLKAATVSVPGSGLAVDQATHDVYVADTANHRVEQFSSAGAFVRAWGWGVTDGAAEFEVCTVACLPGISGAAPGQFEAPAAIAIDNAPGGEGEVYVADFAEFESPGSHVQKFTAEGALVESWGKEGQLGEGPLTNNESFFHIAAIGVDSSGNLWAATGGGMFEFDRSGAFARRTSLSSLTSPPIALAAWAEGAYPTAVSEVRKFDSSGADLGAVFADGESPLTGVAFDPLAEELLIDEGSQVAILAAASCIPKTSPPFCSAAARFGSPQLKGGAGLAVDSESHAVYAADTVANRIDRFILEPPSQPKITAQSVTQVTATSAVFHAELNPRSEATEGPTAYSFQYGPCASAATCATSPFTGETPVGSIAPDFEPHPVTAAVSGLQPATLYHYRLLATNDQGTSAGEEEGGGEVPRTFTTQGTAIFGSPDARQWQLVSPPNKLGARLEPFNQEGGIIQAAADGHAITYLANAATEPEPQGFVKEEQLLSARSSAGWTSGDIGLPHRAATGVATGQGQEYRFFSPDLSEAAVQPFGQFNPDLSPAASEPTAYLRDLPDGAYTPLISGCPEAGPCPPAVAAAADVAPGTVFGKADECVLHSTGSARGICGPQFLGATEDLSHVILDSAAPLLEGAGEHQLYEWAGGQLAQLSFLPGGGQPTGPLFDPVPGTITAGGDRVVWSTLAAPGALYLRDLPRGETLQLDRAKADCPTCESGGGSFLAASPGGSRIFFSANRPLTADSGSGLGFEGEERRDLYECRVLENGAGELECDLTDLTPEAGGEAAEVQGSLPGASTDGAKLYFAALGALTAAPNPSGETPVSGQPNLYLLDEGTTTFIATLLPADQHDWAGIIATSAKASPDGNWLAFMSQRPLTGYDNRDAAGGQPAAEVYLYDAAADRLLCPSCNPSGARPRSIEARRAKLIGAELNWAGSIAASLPLTQRIQIGAAYQQPRYLADSGRLFFNAYDGLLPGDSNAAEDVYQYEPPGVGGCIAASPAFAAANGGCLGLISAGTSGQESGFLDASESGDDVFFLTSSRLVPADEDAARDVYDAHSCEAAEGCLPPRPPSPPACEGDACQQPAVPPNDATPGSLTFSGAGNVKECAKGKQLKKGKCVAKKSKKHKHRAKKKNSNKTKGSGKGKKQKRATGHNRGGHK